MDARSNIKTTLPSRHVTEGPGRAPQRSYLHDLFDVAEIFKKTPYVPDLKPGGRDVAKDMGEVGDLAVLTKTLLDNDADIGVLNVKLTDAEPAGRKTKWQPRKTNHTSGVPGKYARKVGAAVDGAVAHPGGAHEKQCYADI